MIRAVIGATGLLCGGFWLVVNLISGSPQDAAVGVTPVLGGLMVLFWDRLRIRSPWVAPVAVAAGLAGAVAGLAVHRVSTGGMFAWIEYRGWPFEWLSRGGLGDDFDEARRIAEASGWSAEPLRLAVDVVLHSYTSLVLIVGLILLLRRLAPKVPDKTR
ncbi:hypothetical protein ACTI_14210 [Actinoplanes sp. OR16]|nr:hypothetical protein ACTI_14210 [Actinoplanes sp. OR16]